MIKKVAFYTFSPTISALEHYRVYSPLVHAGIEVLEGVKQGQTNLAIISESDLVLFQRDFANHFEAYQDVIQEARKLNKPVVLDLDDDAGKAFLGPAPQAKHAAASSKGTRCTVR